MTETGTNSPANSFSELSTRFPLAIVARETFRDDLTLVVKPEGLRGIIQFLKTDPGHAFVMMSDLLGVDYLKVEEERPERFAVVYILYSFKRAVHLRLKVYVSEETPVVPSIHDLYAAANWFEREVWDLFGITFAGHPNLLRILCHNEFVGHPLRKDYPSDQYQRLKTAVTSTGF